MTYSNLQDYIQYISSLKKTALDTRQPTQADSKQLKAGWSGS